MSCWGLGISGLFLLITSSHFWQCEKCEISLISMSRRSLLSLPVFKFDIWGPRISDQALNICWIYEYKNEQFPHFSLQHYCPWVPSIIIFSSPLPFSFLFWLLEIHLFSTHCLPFSSMEYILSNFFSGSNDIYSLRLDWRPVFSVWFLYSSLPFLLWILNH